MLHPGAFVLSLALPSLIPFHPAGQADQQSDEEAIRSAVNHLITACNHHDTHAFAALFSSDGDFTDGRGAMAGGREHIEQLHARTFAAILNQSHVELTSIRTRFLRSDVASVDVHWQTAADPGGKPRPPHSGLMSLVMVRDAEHWEIAVMHNLDLPVLPLGSPPK